METSNDQVEIGPPRSHRDVDDEGSADGTFGRDKRDSCYYGDDGDHHHGRDDDLTDKDESNGTK